MKKRLLTICFGISLSVTTMAQTTNYFPTEGNKLNQSAYSTENYPGYLIPTNPVNVVTKADAGRAVTKTIIGSSYNAYTAVVSESNCLTANQLTNTVMFTHRINTTWPAPSVNSGFIQSTFSFNGGATWDTVLHVQQQAPNLCRYPSGAIFNPRGNIIPSNQFSVVSGPITNGSTTTPLWTGNYFASTKLDKTNNNSTIALNSSGTNVQSYVRIDLQSNDSLVVVTGTLLNDVMGTTYQARAYRGASVNTARYNGSNGFIWKVDSIKPNFFIKPTGAYPYANEVSHTAWSQDGLTGYLIFNGVEAGATGSGLSYQLIVYKTTDAGATWNKMPAFDFSSIPSINNKLLATYNGTMKKAWFTQDNGMDAVVDADNELHIVSLVRSGFYESADSINYYWNLRRKSATNVVTYPTYIFDTHTTPTGWDATFIDSLRCKAADTLSTLSDYSSTAAWKKIQIDARIQVSKSTDGTHLFYFWLDSDPESFNGENAIPDIFGRGRNLTDSTMTPTTKFTESGDNYFLYISNITLVNGSTYQIPATTSLYRSIVNPDGDVSTPFDHYYISDIEFDENDFVGIDELTKSGNITISRNYPNPFRTSTSIDLTLKNAENVSVNVFNTIGQTVLTKQHGKFTAGTHTLNIDGNSLNSGIYFYTIKAGNDSITGKMIVQ